uniref:Uncharacterized protein n=1 Tax=Ciona savignyi TaxID=51511 RepID=H2Z1G1_CIOSA
TCTTLSDVYQSRCTTKTQYESSKNYCHVDERHHYVVTANHRVIQTSSDFRINTPPYLLPVTYDLTSSAYVTSVPLPIGSRYKLEHVLQFELIQGYS